MAKVRSSKQPVVKERTPSTSSGSSRRISRSAITGRYVTAKHSKANPRTTATDGPRPFTRDEAEQFWGLSLALANKKGLKKGV